MFSNMFIKNSFFLQSFMLLRLAFKLTRVLVGFFQSRYAPICTAPENNIKLGFFVDSGNSKFGLDVSMRWASCI